MISDSALVERFWRDGRDDDCPVIDMHGHMGRFGGIAFPRPSTDAMIRSMDAAGVRMLVFCHHAALFCPEIGNAANVEAVRRRPDRLRAYLAINPNYPEAVAADLASFDQHADVYVGLKILSAYHGVAIDDPRYEPAWRFADRRALPVLAHTWGGAPTCGVAQVRRILETYPNVRLIMGHSLHGAWDEAAAIANDHPNAYLELTAVLDDRGVMERFVAAGCSERMLFGTDLPWFSPHHGIGAVLAAEISDEDRRNILYRNAEKLLASVGVAVGRRGAE